MKAECYVEIKEIGMAKILLLQLLSLGKNEQRDSAVERILLAIDEAAARKVKYGDDDKKVLTSNGVEKILVALADYNEQVIIEKEKLIKERRDIHDQGVEEMMEVQMEVKELKDDLKTLLENSEKQGQVIKKLQEELVIMEEKLTNYEERLDKINRLSNIRK